MIPFSHLHLHVISSDLCSPSLRQKKHYNSFHPKLGFFLHIDEVLSWFDKDSASFDKEVAIWFFIHLQICVDPPFVSQVMSLQKGLHEPLLKEDLQCWRCRETLKTIPKLKEHLEREKKAEASREKKACQGKKRKDTEEGYTEEGNPDRGEPSSKKRAITASGDA